MEIEIDKYRRLVFVIANCMVTVVEMPFLTFKVYQFLLCLIVFVGHLT